MPRSAPTFAFAALLAAAIVPAGLRADDDAFGFDPRSGDA